MSEQRARQVFVDVDDTLIRTVGTKRIPLPNVIKEVERLFGLGHELTCWSTGGAEYAQEVAEQFGIGHCFVRFLAKPELMIDDQEPGEWRTMTVVHPASIEPPE